MTKSTIRLAKEIWAMNASLQKPNSFVNVIQEKIYRPLSCLPSAVFVRLGVTANQVTAFRFLVFVASLVLMAGSKDVQGVYLGLGIYFFSEVLDFSDGSVARFTKKTSGFGAFIDGYTDFYNSFVVLVIPFIMQSLGASFFEEPVELYFFVAVCISMMSHNFFSVRLGLTVRLIRMKNNQQLGSCEHVDDIQEKSARLMPIYSSLQSLTSLIFIFSVLVGDFRALIFYLIIFKLVLLNLEIPVQIRRYKKLLENNSY